MTRYKVTLTMPGGESEIRILEGTGILDGLTMSDLGTLDEAWSPGDGDTITIEQVEAGSDLATLDTFIKEAIAGRGEDTDEEIQALLIYIWPDDLGKEVADGEHSRVQVYGGDVHFLFPNVEEGAQVSVTWTRPIED